ncbi:hypothetical protein RZS08_54540, partial [Arthrospira platensis SPKY1]|nr:hypothetical protein [Arthrospira platensis SPKY1]
VALIPQQQAFFIEIALPEGLRTSYGIELPFSPGQPARAAIITEDRRLLERIVERVYLLWQR